MIDSLVLVPIEFAPGTCRVWYATFGPHSFANENGPAATYALGLRWGRS